MEELGIYLFYHSFRQEHSKIIPEKVNLGFPVFTAYCNDSTQFSDGLTGTPASGLPSHDLNKMAPDVNFSQPYGFGESLKTALKSIKAQFIFLFFSFSSLVQGLANVFCQRPDSQCFRPSEP